MGGDSHTALGAVRSGLVFDKENTHQQSMELHKKEGLMKAIRKEHLSLSNRNSTPAIARDCSQLLLTTMENLRTVNVSNDG